MTTSWIVLIVSGVFETMWATALAQDGWWRRPLPLAAFAIGLLISMGGLGYALRTIPVGTGYAVWTGTGAVVTAAFGILVLGESAAAARLACIALIVSGIVGLKLFH